MKVSIVSFSYPRGVPDDADDDYWGGFVFDCRSMPDPHGEGSLRGYSGLDKQVIEFFARHKDRVDRFLDAAESLVRQTIEAAPETGRDYLQVAFGCGVNKLPCDAVADQFRRVLEEPEFKGKFKELVFAILEGRGSARRPVEEQGKFAPFYEMFGRWHQSTSANSETAVSA